MEQPCNFEYKLNDPYVRFVYPCRIGGIQKLCRYIISGFFDYLLTQKLTLFKANRRQKLIFERPPKPLPLFVYVVFECSQLGDDQGNDCILSDYKLCLPHVRSFLCLL